MKFKSRYFDEYHTNILEFLNKYKEFALLSFQELCEKHLEISDAMINDLKILIGQNAWYENFGIDKEEASLVKEIVRKYNDKILAREEVSQYKYEEEIHAIIKKGFSGARTVAIAFYEREEFMMVCLKFYPDAI